MNTQQKITTVALMIGLVGFTYGAICQDNAKAMEEYMNLAQEKEILIEANKQLNKDKKEESDGWWVDENAKAECIQSWTDHQKQRNQNNIKRDRDIAANSGKIADIEKKMGLIQRSKPLKKTIQQKPKSTMSDTVEKTTDNSWYKRLLKWVESLWYN